MKWLVTSLIISEVLADRFLWHLHGRWHSLLFEFLPETRAWIAFIADSSVHAALWLSKGTAGQVWEGVREWRRGVQRLSAKRSLYVLCEGLVADCEFLHMQSEPRFQPSTAVSSALLTSSLRLELRGSRAG